MAFNLGNIGATAFKWFGTLFFWVVFAFGIVIIALVILKVRKFRKLKIPVLETVSLGNKKTASISTLGGWFKTRSTFFGMYDYGGDDRFLLKDGREVQAVSTEDYQDINGRKGLVVRRKGDDPKVLVPVNKMYYTKESDEIIMEVAPADYRDASSKILIRNQEEAVGKFEKFLTLVLPYFMIGGFIVAMILTFQYAKHSQAEAWLMNLEAIKLAQEMKSDIIASQVAPFLLFFKRSWFK